MADPRMSSLKSVTNLASLWTGSKDNFRWGGRQPLRRRRGDVHGDLTSIVLQFDWEGKPLSKLEGSGMSNLFNCFVLKK